MPPVNINPQWVVLARAIILVLGGALVSWGVMTQEQLAMISDVGTVTAILAAGGLVVTLVIGWRAHSPKGMAAMAGNTPGIHAVIADPAIAGSSKTPDNVVATVQAAAQLPGVPKS